MMEPLDVTARALRAEPQRYDGPWVRFRDVVHDRFEGMSAAGWTKAGGDIDAEGSPALERGRR